MFTHRMRPIFLILSICSFLSSRAEGSVNKTFVKRSTTRLTNASVPRKVKSDSFAHCFALSLRMAKNWRRSVAARICGMQVLVRQDSSANGCHALDTVNLYDCIGQGYLRQQMSKGSISDLVSPDVWMLGSRSDQNCRPSAERACSDDTVYPNIDIAAK